ncbi:hypothetical protein [Zhongshania aliphaticivorans]|uniref:hypothetical protein n=1 Tax=Zhongshania aliphaticivorans TaxID=1470434 RepID=UPI0012E6E9FD|nr:hypothetical protein [Zhongshania aliphaticivorans]CAA0114832.1 Uncharacterised protein [Zhongshania aliphaticivorans]
MNTIIKCSLFICLGLGLSACNNDDGKYDGRAGGGDSSISANQLLTSVIVQDANAEPISVNDKNITDSSDSIDVDSL